MTSPLVQQLKLKPQSAMSAYEYPAITLMQIISLSFFSILFASSKTDFIGSLAVPTPVGGKIYLVL